MVRGFHGNLSLSLREKYLTIIEVRSLLLLLELNFKGFSKSQGYFSRRVSDAKRPQAIEQSPINLEGKIC